MDMTTEMPGDRLYDPARHESQVVAAFEDLASADRARTALLGAGVPPTSIDVLHHQVDEGRRGLWDLVKRIFLPEQDMQEYDAALQRGNAVVVVTPGGASERDVVIEALESSRPLDIDAAVAPDPREHTVRIVEERHRVGWREPLAGGLGIRSYVAERPGAARLFEERIEHE